MITTLSILDTLSFSITAWAAFAVLHDRHEVRNWRDAWLTLALIATYVFALCGAIATTVQPINFAWWMHGLLYSVAALGVWNYEHRFGIVRHFTMLRTAVVKAWERRPGHRGSA